MSTLPAAARPIATSGTNADRDYAVALRFLRSYDGSTDEGERIMSQARAHFLELDTKRIEKLGKKS